GQAAPTFADATHVARASASLRLMFPVADGGVQYFQLPIDYPAWNRPVISINDWVTLLQDFTATILLTDFPGVGFDQAVGWMPYIAGTQAGGIANTRPFGGLGTTALALQT